MIADAIYNENNQVAIKWVLQRPPVKVEGSGRVYIFTYRAHVCMAWVEEEDVARLLGVQEKTCNCNHGTYKHAFALANQLDVCLFTTGDRCK
jgi:hypothetical protein